MALMPKTGSTVGVPWSSTRLLVTFIASQRFERILPRAICLLRSMNRYSLGSSSALSRIAIGRNDHAHLAGECLADAGDAVKDVAAFFFSATQQANAELDGENIDLDEFLEILAETAPAFAAAAAVRLFRLSACGRFCRLSAAAAGALRDLASEYAA